MKIKYFKCKSGAPQYFPSNDDISRYWNGNPFEACVGVENVKKALGCLPTELFLEFYNGEFKGIRKTQ